jgi:branched-chain amino acid transport system substrate-binding protein
MNFKRLGAHLALILLAAAIVPVKAAEEPYDLYAILSLTGPSTFIGRAEASTIGVAVRYANATGGIKGRPIHLIVEDDQTNPSTAVQLASQLQAKHVPLIMGPGVTCRALMGLVTAGPVIYCLTNAVHPPTGSYTFSFTNSTLDYLKSALRYLKAKGAHKIGLLTSLDATGQDGDAITPEALQSPEFKSMQVVASEHIGLTDLSANAQIARIKAAGAEVLEAWPVGTTFGTVLRSVQEVGFDGIVMTNGGNISNAIMEQYANVLPKQMIFAGHGYMRAGTMPAQMRLANADFLDQMHQAGIANPDPALHIAWDPMLIYIDALRHIGPQATATQIRDYIVKLHDFAGINGMYDFRRGDQRGLDPMASVVVRWNAPTSEFVTVSKPGGAPF